MQTCVRAVAGGLFSATLGLACLGGAAAAADKTIHITLITKDPDNHFWTAMVEGTKEAAKGQNVEVTVEAGRDQTDADGQIRAIEYAISRGDDAILIANNGPAVDAAIKKARDAGLYVIALDTPTNPTSLVDATFASDNFEAGTLIGKWAAARLGGKPATVAMLDLFADKVVTIDLQRDHGFLTGMGIAPKDNNANGREDKTGSYSGGQGGKYEVVCHQATNGAEDGGRSAMESCLSINPDVNVVFTANETSGIGAVQALKAAGKKDVLVVSIDGSCRGVKAVADGDFGALAQQYPSAMGRDGVQAVIDHIRNHKDATPPAGKDFINTGIKLVTDQAVPGMDGIDSKAGAKLCW